MTKEAIAKSPSGRVRRTPIGERNVLTVKGKDPNYVYRVVNAEGDRIAEFEAAGYELVDANDVQIGDKRVNKASPEGSHAQASVGAGLKAYVMRIQKDWYEEDQAAKQARVDAIEHTTKENAQSGNYGKIEITRREPNHH